MRDGPRSFRAVTSKVSPTVVSKGIDSCSVSAMLKACQSEIQYVRLQQSAESGSDAKW